MKKLADSIQVGLSGITLRTLVPLSELTSFRIGGQAAACATIRGEQELARALAFCRDEGIPCHLLGNGTNVLAPDEGFAGLLLRLVSDEPPLFSGNRVLCGAGQSLASVAKESVARGLMGLEALAGIPGTVGGACAMNAGAYGAEMSAVLTEVRVLRDPMLAGQRIETVTVQPGDLGYRKSVFASPDCIVLSAALALRGDDGGAAERMADFSRRRREKQPLTLPSAGSVFRRPEGHFAGALIEQCGLKGARIGGAEVSELHAGFIVNRGGATCADVLELISRIQTAVFEWFGVRLEREIKLLSEV